MLTYSPNNFKLSISFVNYLCEICCLRKKTTYLVLIQWSFRIQACAGMQLVKVGTKRGEQPRRASMCLRCPQDVKHCLTSGQEH